MLFTSQCTAHGGAMCTADLASANKRCCAHGDVPTIVLRTLVSLPLPCLRYTCPDRCTPAVHLYDGRNRSSRTSPGSPHQASRSGLLPSSPPLPFLATLQTLISKILYPRKHQKLYNTVPSCAFLHALCRHCCSSCSVQRYITRVIYDFVNAVC